MVIKNIIKFCDIYNVDLTKHLPEKIESNKNRPYKYKKGDAERTSKGEDYPSLLKQMTDEELADEFMKIKDDPEVVKILKIFETLGYCPREVIEFELNRRMRISQMNNSNQLAGKSIRESSIEENQPH